uniref:Hexosyltransferase n=1 Tax=Heterorhabditis bacteriophora TaxID=37862 RepID=A0A1I7W6V1_HETBA
MCGRWLFKISVVCIVVLCVWYSLTHNIRSVTTSCENLPPNNFIHPPGEFSSLGPYPIIKKKIQEKKIKVAQSWIRLVASCKQPPKLVIKIDDDVAIDKLGVEYLIQRYLSRNEYSLNDLGTYCQGMAYLFSGDQINTMSENIDKIQFLWMDDWYVTRGLLNGTNTTIFNIGEHYFATNSESELKVALDRRKKNNTYRSIFGHFRPAESITAPKS